MKSGDIVKVVGGEHEGQTGEIKSVSACVDTGGEEVEIDRGNLRNQGSPLVGMMPQEPQMIELDGEQSKMVVWPQDVRGLGLQGVHVVVMLCGLESPQAVDFADEEEALKEYNRAKELLT